MRIDLDVSDYGVGVFDSAYTFPEVKITQKRRVTAYELEFFENTAKISCKRCNCKKILPTDSLIAAHELLDTDKLILEP